MSTSKMNDVTLIDRIGLLNEQIKDQTAKLESMKEELKSRLPQRQGTAVGKEFTILVTPQEKKIVAWKAICEKIGASDQMIRANTKSSFSSKVTINRN